MAITVFMVRVPEAENMVDPLRKHYDSRAVAGAPAHIVILSPFKAPELITDGTIQKASKVFSSFHPFTFFLNDIGRWPETTFLLARPAHYFTDMTNAICEEFPAYRPYSGMYDEVIPHLTIADKNAENADIAEYGVRRALERHGPIEAKCTAVDLMENSSGAWKTMHTFSLAEETNS